MFSKIWKLLSKFFNGFVFIAGLGLSISMFYFLGQTILIEDNTGGFSVAVGCDRDCYDELSLEVTAHCRTFCRNDFVRDTLTSSFIQEATSWQQHTALPLNGNTW